MQLNPAARDCRARRARREPIKDHATVTFEGLILSGVASLFGSLLAMGAVRIFEKQILPTSGLSYRRARTFQFCLPWCRSRCLLRSSLRLGPHFSRCIYPSKLHSSKADCRVERTAHSIGPVVPGRCGNCHVAYFAGRLRPSFAHHLCLAPRALGFRTDHIMVANLTIPAYRFANRNMTTGTLSALAGAGAASARSAKLRRSSPRSRSARPSACNCL